MSLQNGIAPTVGEREERRTVIGRGCLQHSYKKGLARLMVSPQPKSHGGLTSLLEWACSSTLPAAAELRRAFLYLQYNVQ